MGALFEWCPLDSPDTSAASSTEQTALLIAARGWSYLPMQPKTQSAMQAITLLLNHL